MSYTRRSQAKVGKMSKCLAFVLSGGAARGALQAGALRALLEAGFKPDLLVGTSVGAVNATHLAVKGFTQQSLDDLAQTWREAITAGLLPTNGIWTMVHAFFNRTTTHYHRLQEFFTAHGLGAHLCFRDIQSVRLMLVSADLNSGRPVLYGEDPDDSVIEGLLASTALPLWVPPLEKGDRLLMDGGAVSALPVEPAMAQGATEIIALDLVDPRGILMEGRGFLPMATKLMAMAEQRQTELELALALARGVPVRRIVLRTDPPAPLWEFGRTEELLASGYEIAHEQITRWKSQQPARRSSWVRQMVFNHRMRKSGDKR